MSSVTSCKMANKTALNLHCQKHKLYTATYQTEKTDSGTYNGLVNCQGKLFKSRESHPSKKSAENDAASVALDYLTKSLEKLADNMQCPWRIRNHMKILMLVLSQVYPHTQLKQCHLAELSANHFTVIIPAMSLKS